VFAAVLLFVVAVSDLNVVILPVNWLVKSRQFSLVNRPVQQNGYQSGWVTKILTDSISGLTGIAHSDWEEDATRVLLSNVTYAISIPVTEIT